jgi:hypothetical protein
MSTSEAAVTLTPTEQALLYADQFAPKGSMLKGKENLLLGDGNVAVKTLAEVMLSVAVLALEKAGAARVQEVTRKHLFGLVKRTVVEITPTGTPARFGEGSLEERLSRLFRGAAIDFDDLVYALFEDDMKWPQQHVVDVAKTGLSERGVLQVERAKKLLMFSTVKATVVPERKAELLAGAPTDARALVKAAEGRGTLWATMLKQAASGLTRRTEASNSGDYPSSSD